jgi:small ligand-binding sensory domain FIST
VYLTDHYAAHVDAILADLRGRWPGVDWVGATGLGIVASGVEYFDEPALSLMLCDLPAEHFRVFSGTRPLGRFAAHAANVHADPSTSELAELIQDMSRRTSAGYLFGGLASGHGQARHIAGDALQGGLSGVAFDDSVALVSRVTQGCQPLGPVRRITGCERNVITRLDDEPALDCLMRDLSLHGVDARQALPKLRHVLVGLSEPADPGASNPAAWARSALDHVDRRDAFGSDTRVRHLIGLDPGRRGIAIADEVEVGMTLAFCQRNVQAARRDLMRICTEVREELEPDSSPAPDEPARDCATLAGAVYVSCVARGGAHFGAPSAEIAIVQQALGDVPVVGVFAAGEIARRHLYGYTGVLTVFAR